MGDEELALPKRWNGSDFYAELKDLFDHYKEQIRDKRFSYPYIRPYMGYGISVDTNELNKVCSYILKTIENYFNGFPSLAYQKFKSVMSILMKTPLKVYQKSVFEQFEVQHYSYKDKLHLFRAVKVDDNIHYDRKRVFHTPYNLRAKVSTSRYSIAGFPSLYLGTSLELCCEEINLDIHKNFAIAALFQLERNSYYSDTNIRVIELGIKPQDFIENNEQREKIRTRQVSDKLLKDSNVQTAYLLWYPLIAACSYIRKNKSDPFAAEYIIPQLLMQWIRNETETTTARTDNYKQLIGLRYFSCASVRSSDMGFNYVFPTSGTKNEIDTRYCAVLSKAFKLTEPAFIQEYESVLECEQNLKRKSNLNFIV